MCVRGGQFYYSRNVPKDAQGLIGRTEIWRSLRTDSLKAAVRRVHGVAAQIEAYIESARSTAGLSFDETLLRPFTDDPLPAPAHAAAFVREVAATSDPSVEDRPQIAAMTLGQAYEQYLNDPAHSWSARTRDAFETSRKMVVTETRLKALKPKAKSYKVADERGLYIEVSPSGGRLWRFRYRVGSIEKKLSIGTYPEIGLRQARQSAYEARQMIASGGDPAMEKRKQKIRAEFLSAQTFEAVAREYIDQMMVKKARSFASRVFRYGVATTRCKSDPTAMLRGALITYPDCARLRRMTGRINTVVKFEVRLQQREDAEGRIAS